MRKLIALGLILCGFAWCGSAAFAQKRHVDDFANRRNYEQWQKQVRKEQQQANRRVVPTFTIPQPGYGYPGYGYGNSAYEYVPVPGGYRVINGQMQYVPPHYVLVPRYGW